MKLTEANLKVFQKSEDEFALKIIMPDDSDNYLHSGGRVDLHDVLLIRDLLLDQEIYEPDIEIIRDEKYFRIQLKVQDVNDDKVLFHSRKMNINDVVYERMQLIVDGE